jgi:hypothetical protein
MVNSSGKWVVAVVKENSPGYSRTNWEWSCTYEEAEKLVEGLNTRMGLSKEDTMTIIGSSMSAQHQVSRARHTSRRNLPKMIGSPVEEVREVVRNRLERG